MTTSECVSTDVSILWGIALTLAAIALIDCHLLTPKSLEQLGKRPMRIRDFRGGYDSSLGCWVPHLQMVWHTCAILSLCTVSTWIVEQIQSCIPPLVSCTVTLVSYLGAWYYSHHVLLGVSHPGGPRPHKIQRRPTWKNSTTILFDTANWRCAVAHDAHDDTEKKFDGTLGILTGEPSGRQLWTTTEENSKTSGVEELVQELASGGRAQGFNASVNPNSCDQIFRAQQIRNYLSAGGTAPSMAKAKTVQEAVKKAAHFYSMLLTEDGHWAGDYGGPHFLMPGMIIAWYVMGKPPRMLDSQQITMMIHYITVHQQCDGGWGTHIESPSTMFGTVLMYVAVRLLGVSVDHDMCQRGRVFLQKHGGAVMTASWAKFYLCLLGCMDWNGHNSVPAEMWLLPNWFPFHPGRLWCHCRMVYLPMGYLYGSRFVYDKAETDPVIASLRKELYVQDYHSIQWIKTRHLVAPMDNYSPVPVVMSAVQDVLARYETWRFFQPLKNFVRGHGLKFCIDYMAAEDVQTNFINIGPVNKVLNMLSTFHDAGNDVEDMKVINHMMRIPDYLWVAEDGMKMQGYNGSQCWDTSFAIQAFAEAELLDDFPDVAKKVWTYLERSQILSTSVSRSSGALEYESNNNRHKYYRHVSEGGWPFSTSAHGWPISDCTGEGLKALLCLRPCKAVTAGLADGSLMPVNDMRLESAVNVCLTLQNEDGGWATYENNRGFGWYEQLNPSEVFGDIMIDYSYVECSMATLTALFAFNENYPNHRAAEILCAIDNGKEFLKSIQRPDGSWYGSWACCFCYGVWFGIEGLVKAGQNADCPEIKRACTFLLSHQRANGGWGEDFTSCYDKDYAQNGMDAYGDEGSGVVNTAWALLAISAAKCDNVEAVKRGVHYLVQRQLPCGDWPQEGISGVFNRACGITYTAYRNVFPLWALGRCRAVYGDVLDQ
jgi:squalene/oxidosqualene cyclase-like protein